MSLTNKKSVRIGLLVLGLLGSDHLASAALLSVGDPRYGTDALTLDTSTGLAWLDVTFSTNLTYWQVLAETQPGGAFSGFRYATLDEVSALLDVAGVPQAGPRWYRESSAEAQSIQSLIYLLGATSFQDGHPQTMAMSGTPGGADGCVALALDYLTVYGLPAYPDGLPAYSVTAIGFGDSYSTPTVGSFLVVPIPEPSATILGVFAGVLLLGSRLMVHRQNRLRQPAPAERQT